MKNYKTYRKNDELKIDKNILPNFVNYHYRYKIVAINGCPETGFPIYKLFLYNAPTGYNMKFHMRADGMDKFILTNKEVA